MGTLDVVIGSGILSATVEVADYAKDGKIRAVAVVDNVGNGSNTMLWSTDPQHYTVFEDLNAFYEKVYEYIGEEYLAAVRHTPSPPVILWTIRLRPPMLRSSGKLRTKLSS